MFISDEIEGKIAVQTIQTWKAEDKIRTEFQGDFLAYAAWFRQDFIQKFSKKG